MMIRPATKLDASSIAALSIEVWVGTYLKTGVSAFFADYVLSEFTTENTAHRISDPDQFILVSENETGIDGYICLSANRHNPVSGLSETEISTFYVQPRHHGKGIGSRLLEVALAQGDDDTSGAIWLTTNAQNDPAIAFYLSRGFEKIGETQFEIADEGYLNNVYQYRRR